MIPRPLATAIVIVVTLVWAGNFVAAVFIPGYQSDAALSFVFMSIVGTALALRQDGTGSVMSRVATAARALLPGGTPPPQDPPPTPPEDQKP